MCGIAGIFNLNGKAVAKNDLQQMAVAMRHRGPDGEGFFMEDAILARNLFSEIPIEHQSPNFSFLP